MRFIRILKFDGQLRFEQRRLAEDLVQLIQDVICLDPALIGYYSLALENVTDAEVQKRIEPLVFELVEAKFFSGRTAQLVVVYALRIYPCWLSYDRLVLELSRRQVPVVVQVQVFVIILRTRMASDTHGGTTDFVQISYLLQSQIYSFGYTIGEDGDLVGALIEHELLYFRTVGRVHTIQS